MKYHLTNKTKISEKLINKLIEFSCPKGVDDFNIVMRYANNNSNSSEAISYTKLKIIEISVSNIESYPRLSSDKKLKRFGCTTSFVIKNKTELLLAIMAHELRHIWQINVSNQDFANGKLCPFTHCGIKYSTIYKMESDACRYTKKILNKYRKSKNT